MQATTAMPAIRDLAVFDSCVTLGRVVHTSCPEPLETADAVLAMMDRYRIAEALVHEHHARFIHPMEHGNRRLLDAVRGCGRLHPVWVLEPPGEPGLPPARAVVAEMLSCGVRAARLRMRPMSPLPWLWEDLFAALEERRVPCFLDFGGVATTGDLTDADVNGVRDLALAHPGLPLILSHVMGGLGVHCAVVPLIRRVSNVFLDITGILEFWREVAHEVGPERVLFASGAPFTDPGILIANVQYAVGLDAAAKRLICGGNLRRLMGAVQ